MPHFFDLAGYLLFFLCSSLAGYYGRHHRKIKKHTSFAEHQRTSLYLLFSRVYFSVERENHLFPMILHKTSLLLLGLKSITALRHHSGHLPSKNLQMFDLTILSSINGVNYSTLALKSLLRCFRQLTHWFWHFLYFCHFSSTLARIHHRTGKKRRSILSVEPATLLHQEQIV